jgi:predicted lipoprotein with Yx(FWY)xxD motif
MGWPPLLTHDKPAAGQGIKGSLLGITHRAGGDAQVTYAEHPLYGFAQDTRAGQTKGQDSQEFGASWYVLSATGKKIGH